MTNESETCTILKNSLLLMNELCFKIPDPSNSFSSTIQRPFDMIASYKGNPVYIEVKYMKGLHSFNLQEIRDHQIENLINYKNKINNAECWIVLGINVKRGDNRIYIFKDIFEIEKRRLNKDNYKVKELHQLPYYPIKKNLCQLSFYVN